MTKHVAIVQARMSSKRLPGKVLRPILGEPMLKHIVKRIERSHVFDEVLVATSESVSDDPVAAFCTSENIPCFRGSLDDVLKRFYDAAVSRKAEAIGRFTGDCPLLDPEVI